MTCIHVYHKRLEKKLKRIRETADSMVGIHVNEAYCLSQRQVINRNRRNTLEQTSNIPLTEEQTSNTPLTEEQTLNTPSPEHTYDTADRIVSQMITTVSVGDHIQPPNTVLNSGAETTESQLETDRDIQHEYQYIDIDHFVIRERQCNRDEEIELEVNDAYGLRGSVQRTHRRTENNDHFITRESHCDHYEEIELEVNDAYGLRGRQRTHRCAQNNDQPAPGLVCENVLFVTAEVHD